MPSPKPESRDTGGRQLVWVVETATTKIVTYDLVIYFYSLKQRMYFIASTSQNVLQLRCFVRRQVDFLQP